MISKQALVRKQKQREGVKGEIREAARVIFVRDGYASFSMRKLAAEVGYSPGAIYLYYKSKQELFRSLVEESFDRLYATLQALADRPLTDPAGELKRGLRAYVDWGLSHPIDYQIAFNLPEPGDGPYKPHKAFEFLTWIVSQCFPPRKRRPEKIQQASQAVWSAAHGITSLLIQRPTFPWHSKESLIRKVIDSSVDGSFPTTRKFANKE